MHIRPVYRTCLTNTTHHIHSIPCPTLSLSILPCPSHLQHEPVLHIQHNLLPLPVVSDEGVQCVRVGHPPNQPRVLGQWDHRVAADTAGEGHIAQYHFIIAQHQAPILENHCRIIHCTTSPYIAQLLLELSLAVVPRPQQCSTLTAGQLVYTEYPDCILTQEQSTPKGEIL